MNDDAHRVTVGRDEINLTKSEYELLRLLLINKGKPVSLHRISAEAFGSCSSEGSIKVHVCNVRKKIGHWRISSVYGYGYMMQDIAYFQRLI